MAIAGRGAGMVRRGLLGVEQRHARERRLISQIALVREMPVVDTLDHRQPTSHQRFCRAQDGRAHGRLLRRLNHERL